MSSSCLVRFGNLSVAMRSFGLLAAVLAATRAEAADRPWRNPDGGTFSNAGNWSSGVPGSGDVAGFGLSTPGVFGAVAPYTVGFSADATNQGLRVSDDRVTFDLNGHVYTTSDANVAMQLGTAPGASGRLTVTDGFVILPFQSELQIGVGTFGGSGSLSVTTGGLVIGSPNLIVGLNGSGALNIDNNGDLIADNTTLGMNSGVPGTATITGAGSSLLAGASVIGSGGNGTLNINASGRVDSSSGVLGDLVGSNGIANIDGVNSRWNLSSGLSIGRSGTGALNITGGGRVQSGGVVIAHRDNAGNPGTGAATVSGLNSQWIISGKLSVGINGVGTLDVSNGGLVQSTSGEIGALGAGTNGSGVVRVSDATSSWINSGELFVGATHMGTLRITGGQVQNSNGVVGAYDFFGPGAVTVDGPNSQWINLGDATIGRRTVGTLDITAGGRVESVNGIIGREQHGEGRVTVDGAAGIASWINSGHVTVGSLGSSAVLEIKNGGQVQSDSGAVGSPFTSVANVLVDGSNAAGFDAQWVMAGSLRLWSSSGTLTISNGGRVENLNGIYGKLVTVTGANSRWINLGDLSTDGQGSFGEIRVIDGGRVESVNGSVSGTVSVTGPGSRWINSGALGVGNESHGTLNIAQGGVVQNTNGTIASNSNPSSSTVNVDGSGSQWINSGNLTIGGLQTGLLNITAGGRVQSVDGRVGIGNPGQSALATVAGTGSQWTMSGSLKLQRGDLTILPGGSVVVAQGTTLEASSQLKLQGGTLTTSRIDILQGGGQFNWTSGTLHVGTYHDTLTVPNGGILAPGNSVGVTQIDANYVQLNGSTLEIELGGNTSADLVNVTGFAQLSGNLQLKFLVDFIPPPSATFVVFDSRGITGAFSNVANGQRLLSADGRGSFVVNYGDASAFDPTRIVLTAFVPTPLPGDYNQNGTVDAADYTIWRDRLGSGTSLPNDETPGVGQDDYIRWRSQFGETAGSGSVGISNAAVPEPTTLVMLIIGMLAMCPRRRMMFS